jgi:hypothetical protein
MPHGAVSSSVEAVRAFADDVATGVYPEDGHTVRMDPTAYQEFLRLTDQE